MEPISILASVSAASRAALALSTTIFGFVQATRNVDQTVRVLYDEVTGLNRTLDAISSSVKLQTSREQSWSSIIMSCGNLRQHRLVIVVVPSIQCVRLCKM
jgi:hypothetical protein